MKRLYIIIACIFLTSFSVKAQTNNNFVIVTIEKKSNNGLHKNQTDYWIVDVDSWKDSSEEALFPLYISDFSATDYKECCTNKDLVLFNITKEESFEYESGFLESQKKLKKIIYSQRDKVQTIKKRWATGKKEKITIYLTPITGNFCFCDITHKEDNSKIGYNGKIAIPKSNFIYNKNIVKQLYKDIGEYDYGSLPFLSLHTIQ